MSFYLKTQHSLLYKCVLTNVFFYCSLVILSYCPEYNRREHNRHGIAMYNNYDDWNNFVSISPALKRPICDATILIDIIVTDQAKDSHMW